MRFTATAVEVFKNRARIASHARRFLKGRHTTLTAHLAPAHQEVAGWNAPRLLHWACTIGPQTEAAMTHLLPSRAHPQPGDRAALGLLRLAKAHGNARLEAACQRALQLNAVTYRRIASRLLPRPGAPTQGPGGGPLPSDHANVRGRAYYHCAER